MPGRLAEGSGFAALTTAGLRTMSVKGIFRQLCVRRRRGRAVFAVLSPEVGLTPRTDTPTRWGQDKLMELNWLHSKTRCSRGFQPGELFRPPVLE